jgi:SEC-C motif domain protein
MGLAARAILKRQSMKHSNTCACGSAQTYAVCCALLHSGAAALTAQALMRSRYAAYVLRLDAYVQSTWHRSTRPDDVSAQNGLQWLGLTVKRVWDGALDEAFVEFIARYKIGGGRAERLHEVSRFVREGGHWFYVDGVFVDES